MSKRIKITDFLYDDKNFNKHTEYGMSLLEKSVEKVGIIEAITVSADNKIISGNARQEVISQKFENIEPIIVETDGTRPVILKRNDIKSNSKEFYEAALLANTVSNKNIELDEQIIQEVAVEDFGINVKELGVGKKSTGKLANTMDYGKEGDVSIKEMFPITILATQEELEFFEQIKEKIGVTNNLKAFGEILKLIEL